MRLEAQLDIPTKGKGDLEDIESGLRDFEDAEEETVYRDIKPQISENVENHENPDVPLSQQNVKLPSPIKSSTLCKQTPQIDHAYCDTEEVLDVSWIKELSAKQRSNLVPRVSLLCLPWSLKERPRDHLSIQNHRVGEYSSTFGREDDKIPSGGR